MVPLARSCAQEVQQSTNRGDRKHPFPAEVLSQTRRAPAEATQPNHQEAEEVAEGQPFYLNLRWQHMGMTSMCTVSQGFSFRCSVGHHDPNMDLPRNLVDQGR